MDDPQGVARQLLGRFTGGNEPVPVPDVISPGVTGPQRRQRLQEQLIERGRQQLVEGGEQLGDPDRLAELGLEMLLMGAGMGAGRSAGGFFERMMQRRARGGGTIPDARIAQATRRREQAEAGVEPDTSNAAVKIFKERLSGLLETGRSGAMGTMLGFGGDLAAGGSGTLGAMLGGAAGAGARVTIRALGRMPEFSRDLLANNPTFARWALGEMGENVGRGVGGAAGAASTVAAAEGTEAGARGVMAGVDLAQQGIEGLLETVENESMEIKAAVLDFIRARELAARDEILEQQGGGS